MRKSLLAGSWVVYKMTIHGKPGEVNAVCEQGEWEEMERQRPGYHVLVKSGILREVDAEALARSGSGYVDPALKAKARLAARPAPAAKRAVACHPLVARKTGDAPASA